ncbi:MAG TPA: hypothetical protein VNT02_07630, partial [Burkholderiales bacterium]|nr:hypothetical protein [Burkholderiales bacterium]
MTPQLTIGRMHATYVSPRTRASPDALRGRLDPVLHDRFGSACGGAIADLSAQADESVWVIRHLDVDLGLRLDGVHDDDIATRWANEVARQIARTLRRGPDGATVLRFSDRAAYLAYFVRRLIETGEWDDTLFPRFKGLKVLTRASAAITALTREPDLIERVLATLHGERLLDALLDTLRDDEVEVILDAMGDAAPSLDATLVEQLLPALIDVLLRASCDSLTARMTIEVLLAARAAGAQGPAQTLVATIRHCADLILGSLRRTGNTVDVAARDVASADALIARLPPATRAWLAQPGGQALIAQVASALRGKTVVATAGASHASRTTYAGAWLLLPALESSGVDAAVNILRLTGALRAALRCAVLARCLGNAAAAVDPLLFAACGGPEDQDPDAA